MGGRIKARGSYRLQSVLGLCRCCQWTEGENMSAVGHPSPASSHWLPTYIPCSPSVLSSWRHRPWCPGPSPSLWWSLSCQCLQGLREPHSWWGGGTGWGWCSSDSSEGWSPGGLCCQGTRRSTWTGRHRCWRSNASLHLTTWMCHVHNEILSMHGHTIVHYSGTCLH